MTAVQCQIPIFPAAKHFVLASRHCAAQGSPFLSTQKVHRPRSYDLYILMLGTYSGFTRENNFLVLGVCFPQTCSSAGCMFAASRSRLHVYTTTDVSQIFKKRFEQIELPGKLLLAIEKIGDWEKLEILVQTKSF